MNPVPLNLPGRIARYFVDSRLTLVLGIVLIAVGLIGLIYTPREENPQIVVPGAEVTVTLPGADPEEVEHLLLAPLEATLMGISGVKHVYGEAHDGFARIAVEFEVGEDEDPALVRVYDHVLGLELPENAGAPRIRSLDVDDVPVFTVTLASKRYSGFELRRMASRVLERLRSVSGVGAAYVVGGQKRELRIHTSPERLAAFDLSLPMLADAVQSADLNLPLQPRVFDDGHRGENRDFRIQHRLAGAEQLRQVVVREQEGRLLRVSDVATVKDGPTPEPSHYTRLGFGPADTRTDEQDLAAVTVAVAKRAGVNAVNITRELRERIARMQQGFLPPGVELVVTRDDGQRADRAVNTLIVHLFIAIGAVSLVLLLFLGLRAALVVAIAIPLVFAAVMAVDLVAGPTLNRITLYSLILSLGMLVDDAIVVIENAHRHFCRLPRGASPAERAGAIIAATHEIGNPTTLATFTVVAVFLSLLLVTGMLGEYFYPAAFNVPVAMIASLLIAYSVTPYIARRLLPATEGREGRMLRYLHAVYDRIMGALIQHRAMRRLFYVLVLILLGLSLLQPAWQFVRPQGIAGQVSQLGIPLAFLPRDNKDTFLIHIHLPETTPLEVTDRAARDMEALLLRDPDLSPHVRHWVTHVGIPSVIDFNGLLKGSAHNVGPEYAEIRVNLTPKSERSASSIDLVHALRPAMQDVAENYPGGNIQLIEDPPGPPVRATVLGELYGSKSGPLRDTARSLVREFRNTWDMAEVWTSVAHEVPEYRFLIDRERAALAGVTPQQVAAALRHHTDGVTLALAHPEGERDPVPVRLFIPREQRVEPDQLDRAFVMNENGKRIPLSTLVTVERHQRPYVIRHKNSERVEYIGGELAGSAPVYAVLDIDRRIDGRRLDDTHNLRTANLRFNPVRPDTLQGYQLLWDGELRLTLDAFRDMGIALMLSLGGIFLLLVGYYRSFRLPILAMVAVPLAFIGVFPAHWLFAHSFSAASMIGVIALAGVVVRNSLLLIDFARENLRKGMSPDEAAQAAGRVRLQPILLTTLALALGTAIMVPDPVFGGLALALIFGAISSALLGVLVIPLLWRDLSIAQTARD